MTEKENIPTTARELHRQAMEIADEAILAVLQDKDQDAQRLFRQSYQLEIQAADMHPDNNAAMHSRSITYKNAATLVFYAGDIDQASDIIATARHKGVPDFIEKELQKLEAAIAKDQDNH